LRGREKLIYTNEREEAVEFSTRSRYHVNDVSGLSDVRNTIYAINSLGQDGDSYIHSRIESRDIEIVGNVAGGSEEEAARLRGELTRVLNPHLKGRLTYERGEFKRVIDCRVNNALAYTRDIRFEKFTVQLIALNPFWREVTEKRTDIAMWIGDFEFPIPDGLEIISGEWRIGHREPALLATITNNGDVSTGMEIIFRAVTPVLNPSLMNTRTLEYIKINATLEAGDTVKINTRYGNKRVSLERDGVESNLFSGLDPASSYMQLETGDNIMRYDADNNKDGLEVVILHTNQYLGV
jgi:hypothetical protein